MNLKLSIITVNRNNKEGLIKTIESVVNQTTADYEYIIIDGASTDGSREVIEQYATHPVHGKKVTCWVSEPDSGIYNAMNKGIGKATGDFCLFLNSGDWLVENGTLEQVLPQIDGAADVYYGDAYKVHEKKIEIWKMPDNFDLKLLYTETISHQSSFIKTYLLKNNLYNELLYIVSDWEWFIVSYIQNKCFIKLPFIISYCDMNGISNVQQDKRIAERNKVLNSLFLPVIKRELEKNYKYQSEAWFKCLILSKKNKFLDCFITYFFRVINKILRVSI